LEEFVPIIGSPDGKTLSSVRFISAERLQISEKMPCRLAT